MAHSETIANLALHSYTATFAGQNRKVLAWVDPDVRTSIQPVSSASS
jgi:hypothetical protein